MKRLFFITLLVVACGRGEPGSGNSSQTEPATASDITTDPLTTDSVAALLAQALPPMPRHPNPAAGQLVVVSAGPDDLSGRAVGRAGRCLIPAMVQVVAENIDESAGRSWAVLLLLQVPEGELTVAYPVAIVEEGFPEPPASQIAVQLLTAGGLQAFQGVEGVTEVYAFDDELSGRFAITVHDLNSDQLVQVAGSFQGLPLTVLSAEQCLPAAALGGA